MTDQTKLLTSNLHLIRYAVDRCLDNLGDMAYDTYSELKEFQHQLEKQEITGDSP